MGKGSARRREDIAKIWDNWDAIFKKDPLPEQKPTPTPEPNKNPAK